MVHSLIKAIDFELAAEALAYHQAGVTIQVLVVRLSERVCPVRANRRPERYLSNHAAECFLWLDADGGVGVIVLIGISGVAVDDSEVLAAAHAHSRHVLIVLEAIDFLRLVRRRSSYLELLLQLLDLCFIKFVLPLELVIDIHFVLLMHFLDLLLEL